MKDSRLRSFNRDYRTELSCGCVINMRVEPMSEGAKFMCPYGKGHGYTLPWMKTWKVGNEERPRVNQKFTENEEGNGR